MKTELIYGAHVVESLLRNRPDIALEIWMSNTRDEQSVESISKLATKQGISVQRIDRKKLDLMTNDAIHQGVVAKIQQETLPGEHEFNVLLAHEAQNPFFLFLDGIQDPQNLGACIRTAEAAGVQAVLFQKDRSTTLTAAARKAAAGAAERMKVFQLANLARGIETAKKAGIWVVGATGHSNTTLYSLDLKGPLAVVMGAEGSGLRARIAELCDYQANIPMAGGTESLNVSVATGIVLFEARRQRQS